MDEALFNEWWGKLNDLHGEALGQLIENVTPLDVAKYLDKLHKKAERYNLFKHEIENLKHLINRL